MASKQLGKSGKAEVTVDVWLECADCGEDLKYEEDQINMIFRIKPCQNCVEKEIEKQKKEIKQQLRKAADNL